MDRKQMHAQIAVSIMVFARKSYRGPKVRGPLVLQRLKAEVGI